MAADIKIKYGTSAQALTITLASLANANLRQSTFVDNATNLFLNALVTASFKLNASGVSSGGVINIYAFGTTDGGATYTSGAGAADAAYSGDKLNLLLVASLDAAVNSATVSTTFDIASAFGGSLPQQWGLVVENLSGAALDATAGNHSIKYQGILGQTV